jgi:hypothetical protein
VTDCAFCRIIAGDAPAGVASEDDETFAIVTFARVKRRGWPTAVAARCGHSPLEADLDDL